MSRTIVAIRAARPDDAEAILDIYRPIVTESPVSFEDRPPSTATMRERLADPEGLFPWFVAVDDMVLGYAYAGPHRARAAYQWTVETSVYIHGDHRKTGVGRQLYERLFQALVDRGYRSAMAIISLPNPASVAFHEALGFTPVGVIREAGYKLGSWWDVGWWQRMLARPDGHPPAAPHLP